VRNDSISLREGLERVSVGPLSPAERVVRTLLFGEIYLSGASPEHREARRVSRGTARTRRTDLDSATDGRPAGAGVLLPSHEYKPMDVVICSQKRSTSGSACGSNGTLDFSSHGAKHHLFSGANPREALRTLSLVSLVRCHPLALVPRQRCECPGTRLSRQSGKTSRIRVCESARTREPNAGPDLCSGAQVRNENCFSFRLSVVSRGSQRELGGWPYYVKG
jgi:hypothetical protein